MSDDDFEIAGNTLIYTDHVPIVWTTMAEIPLQIRNETTTDCSFVFVYDDRTTQTVSAASGHESEPFRLQEKSLTVLLVRSRGQGSGAITPPMGPTVKHMSKGGGNFQRFDWGSPRPDACAMLNLAFLDKLMQSDLIGWMSGRDANYTFEMLIHPSLAADDDSFTITVSAHYSNLDRPRQRLFWRVDAAGELTLSAELSEASWFTRTRGVPFSIMHEDRHLARREVAGDNPRLYFDADRQNALMVTPTDVKWVYPRERRSAR